MIMLAKFNVLLIILFVVSCDAQLAHEIALEFCVIYSYAISRSAVWKRYRMGLVMCRKINVNADCRYRKKTIL